MRDSSKIIGQDKLLEKEVYPRLKKSIPFIVTGQRGIGKSEIIRWSFAHYLSDKVFFSGSLSYGEILKLIADAQGIEEYKKMKNTDLEREVIKSKKIALFMDDIERATPKLIHFLTALNETWTIYMSGNEPFREELKRLTWGKPMAVDRYKREGTKQCYFEGKLRLSDGNIKEGSWLVIGTEGTGPFTPVAVYDSEENKIIHIPDQAEFLKAKIKVTEKDWHTLKLSGPSQLTKGTVYFKPGNKWHIAKEGEFVFGVLQYEGDVTLKPSTL